MQTLDINKKRALTKIGLFVRDETRLITPVKTGNLRNSYDYDVLQDSVNIGTNVDYGKIVEKRKPHLKPAIYNNLDQIKKIIENEMK